MSDITLYQPSNGTEGMMFMDAFCDRCYRDNADRQCELIALSMAFNTKDPEYPIEWCYGDDGNPTCTKFVLDGSRESESIQAEKRMQRIEAAGQTNMFAREGE